MSINNPTNPDDDTPDWLKNLQSGNNNDESTPPNSSEETFESFQDGALQNVSPPPNNDRENKETPDWLQNIREKEGTADLPKIEEDANIDDSDWLEKIKNQEEENILQPPENDEGTEETFLDRIQSIKETESAKIEKGNDINWVEGISYEENISPKFNITKPTPIKDDIELSNINPTDAKTIDKANDLWLSNLTSSQNKPVDSTDKELSLENFANDIVDEIQPESEKVFNLENEDELPEPVSPFIDDPNNKELAALQTESLPDWLVELQKNSPEVELPIKSHPSIDEIDPINDTLESIDEDATLLLDNSDIPDWLSEISPSDDHNIEDVSPLPIAPRLEITAEEAEKPEEDNPEGFPTWLNALKPDEFTDDEELIDEIVTEGQEETYGPLTGLRNLLPAEPDVVQFGSPSIPIIGLEVTDSQFENAKILHHLATSQDQSVEVEKRKTSVSNPLIRIAIAIVLYISVFIPTLIDSKSLAFPDPQFPPAEIEDAAQIINDLKEDSIVLIAFDYQPGFAGEIEAAASSMVNYIDLKGSTIVTIATLPTGQGLAKRLFNQIEVPFINLGYVSGEMAALNNFTHYPQETIRPILTSETLFLSKIDSINNFDLVMVLTDNADSGRAWVEQVQPQLTKTKTPLIMALSAQAEPLLSPYYKNEPKQIAGFSSGLIGGAYFEQYIGNENIARSYWDSYGSGLSISILILATSAVYNISLNIINRMKKDKK